VGLQGKGGWLTLLGAEAEHLKEAEGNYLPVVVVGIFSGSLVLGSAPRRTHRPSRVVDRRKSAKREMVEKKGGRDAAGVNNLLSVVAEVQGNAHK
jgi:hypothetical protein